jgi:hypothetical protein
MLVVNAASRTEALYVGETAARRALVRIDSGPKAMGLWHGRSAGRSARDAHASTARQRRAQPSRGATPLLDLKNGQFGRRRAFRSP